MYMIFKVLRAVFSLSKVDKNAQFAFAVRKGFEMHLHSNRIILLGFGKIIGNKNDYITKNSRPNTVLVKYEISMRVSTFYDLACSLQFY
jgi:hypothetical protein